MMGNWPPPSSPNFRVIHTFGPQSMGVILAASAAAAQASTAWNVASEARFIPFVVPEPVLAQQIGVINGATASGNIDVGIYDSQGSKLVTNGGVAQSGTSAEQLFNITDTALDRGLYYMAVVLDNTTGTFMREALGGSFFGTRSLGLWAATSAYPLPSTVTFATTATIPNYIPSMYVICESI